MVTALNYMRRYSVLTCTYVNYLTVLFILTSDFTFVPIHTEVLEDIEINNFIVTLAVVVFNNKIYNRIIKGKSSL
jgi:hypothetical protein